MREACIDGILQHMHAAHRFFEEGGRGRRDASPYFFHRTTLDALEEAVREILKLRLEELQHPKQKRRSQRTPIEQDVLTEQRRTLFAHDARMRSLFQDDFAAFCAAMDDPAEMERIFDAHIAHIEREHRHRPQDTDAQHDIPSGWNHRQAIARAWEDQHASDGISDGGAHDGHVSLDDDPVYDAAFRWSCRVERWSRARAAEGRASERDLQRIAANALLIPAKIAFAFHAHCGSDLSALEIAALGYRQASLFCLCVLDALGNCYGRRIGKRSEVHEFLDEGKELLADLQSMLAETEEELRRWSRGA